MLKIWIFKRCMFPIIFMDLKFKYFEVYCVITNYSNSIKWMSIYNLHEKNFACGNRVRLERIRGN